MSVTEWVWPADSRELAAAFGENEINGYISDHVNITGEKGDAVYAVTDGKITDTGFDGKIGNYVELTDGEGRVILYGHLEDMSVETGDLVKAGETIGKMGKTGMATGVNLYFAMYEDGKAVNPLQDYKE